MKAIGTLAAAWLFLTALAFFVARFVLFVRLASARAGVRMVWSGIPGYLERKYRAAPAEVRVRLASSFRVHEVLKVVLLLSLALGLLGLVVATKCMTLRA